MGMYTEFYFRANIKDGPMADWLDEQINGDGWFQQQPHHTQLIHEWFNLPRWSSVFIGGGAVYQESRTPIFRRKASGGGEPYHHQLVLASSLKDYGGEFECGRCGHMPYRHRLSLPRRCEACSTCGISLSEHKFLGCPIYRVCGCEGLDQTIQENEEAA